MSDSSKSPEFPVNSSVFMNTDEFSDEDLGDLLPSPTMSEIELQNMSRLEGGVLPTDRGIYGDEAIDITEDATSVSKEVMVYDRQDETQMACTSTNFLSYNFEDDSSDYVQPSSLSSSDSDSSFSPYVVAEPLNFKQGKMTTDKSMKALIFVDDDELEHRSIRSTDSHDSSSSDEESDGESSHSGSDANEASSSGRGEESDEEDQPVEPVRQRRKVEKSSSDKPLLGGKPRGRNYKSDPIEPPHDGSDDDQYELDAEPEAHINPPPHFLGLWECNQMAKDSEVVGLVGDGKDMKKMWRLRRRPVATAIPLTGSSATVTVAAQARQPNEAAYGYYRWVRRKYEFDDVEGLEMYEKSHLLKNPSHPTAIRVCDGFFRAGFPIPIPRLTTSLLNYYEKAPCQLSATAYAQIALVLEIGKHFDMEISLEEFQTVFYLQPVLKGSELRKGMVSGQVVYSLNRRPRTGFFQPPNKLSYKQTKVYELIGNYESTYKNKLYPLLHKTCNDYDVKELNQLDTNAKDSVVISRIKRLTIAQRRATFPKFKKWFPDWLVEAEWHYDRNLAYTPPPLQAKKKKQLAKFNKENEARKARGEPPLMPPKGLKSLFAAPSASTAPKESSKAGRKRARPTHPASPRLKPKYSSVELEVDEGLNTLLDAEEAQAGNEARIVTVAESLSSRKDKTSWKTGSSSDVVSKIRRVPTMVSYKPIENESTKKNRVFSDDLKKNKRLLFNPHVQDGESKSVSQHATATDDPVVAGLYENFALRPDHSHTLKPLHLSFG